MFSFPLVKYLGVDLLGHNMFNFLNRLFSKEKLHWFTFPPAVYEGSNFTTSSPTPVTCFFYYSPMAVKWHLIGFGLCCPNGFPPEKIQFYRYITYLFMYFGPLEGHKPSQYLSVFTNPQPIFTPLGGAILPIENVYHDQCHRGMQMDRRTVFKVKGAGTILHPVSGRNCRATWKRVAAERVDPGLNAQGERDWRFGLMRTPRLPHGSAASVAGPLHLEESSTSQPDFSVPCRFWMRWKNDEASLLPWSSLS